MNQIDLIASFKHFINEAIKLLTKCETDQSHHHADSYDLLVMFSKLILSVQTISCIKTAIYHDISFLAELKSHSFDSGLSSIHIKLHKRSELFGNIKTSG